MFMLSNKVHCIGYNYMVEDSDKDLIGMNCDCNEQANLVTHHKWPMPSQSTPAVFLHLEGQEVFGSMKRRANVALRLEGNSHMHDRVNFSRPIVNTMSNGFIDSNVDVGKFSGIVRDEAFCSNFSKIEGSKVCAWGWYICGELRGAHHHQILIALQFKKTWWALQCPNHYKKNKLWHT